MTILYQTATHYVIAVDKGFEVYRNVASGHAVRCASIGNGPGPNLGLARAIAEADRRSV